ncbi:Phage terminase, small subunit [Bradyrhizobium sp. Rc2d]|uniref:terminase small subunit n=1 Tax=Bradyrhizobium sp. Rc2d TaxID=1855321 RepID=UPI00088E5507|nr:terminase small subunit [Bradyrhizobium sp. Rc2d]SDG45545.1 Phage terminase, small subunit [Bradyrhizobium sp. Rc2d]
MALTAKQQRFVENYLLDLNSTQAAIRAGYSKGTADKQGPRLLSNPEVKAAIDAAKSARSERTQVDADWMLRRLVDEAEADLADFYDGTGDLKPIEEWPEIWRQSLVAGVEIDALYEGSGEDRRQTAEFGPRKVAFRWPHSYAHAVEVTIHELARATGKDPLEYRLALLREHPRHVAALGLLAEKAQWDRGSASGKRRGLALHESFGTIVCAVVDVTVANRNIKLDRVICVVDCGIAANPDVVVAQIEGGIGFGLGAALHGEITLVQGVVEQSNFDSYVPLRMSELPTTRFISYRLPQLRAASRTPQLVFKRCDIAVYISKCARSVARPDDPPKWCDMR